MPTVECCYLVTSLALCRQPVCSCTHPPTHTQTYSGPLLSVACVKTLGDCPPSHQPPTPTQPSVRPFPRLSSPLPLTPSAMDHCLLSLSSVALLVWGGGGRTNRYIIVWSSLAPPPPLRPPLPTRPDPIHSPQKRHLYHPTVRE